MTQNAALSLVTDEEDPLAVARQQLKAAQARRAEAQQAFEEISNQHRRIEALIGNQKPALDARIAKLEKEQASILEKWALTPDAPEPELPHFNAIEDLKRAARLADLKDTSAKVALARMNSHLAACQEDSARAIAGVREAGCTVLVETAKEMVAELEQVERRSALLRGYLEALSRHFTLEGARRLPGGELVNVINQMIPRGPFTLSEPGLNEAVGRWKVFADRLMVNSTTAELEMP